MWPPGGVRTVSCRGRARAIELRLVPRRQERLRSDGVTGAALAGDMAGGALGKIAAGGIGGRCGSGASTHWSP